MLNVIGRYYVLVGMGFFFFNNVPNQNFFITRCVDYCPEVNMVITGSWDSNIKLWDPRGPREVGTYQQPNKVGMSWNGEMKMGFFCVYWCYRSKTTNAKL